LPQGHVYRSSTDTVERWFNPDWLSLDRIPTTPVDLPLLKVGRQLSTFRVLFACPPACKTWVAS
jgi:hypothetical protein